MKSSTDSAYISFLILVSIVLGLLRYYGYINISWGCVVSPFLFVLFCVTPISIFFIMLRSLRKKDNV